MGVLTKNAKREVQREKLFMPQSIIQFLNKKSNFISISEGIKRELKRLFPTDKEEQLYTAFKKLIEDKNLNSSETKQEKKWYQGIVQPSPKSSIKLCFAFELKEQNALDFLWNVCRINGFNFRKPEDIIFCYCLDNNKTYQKAESLITQYHNSTETQSYSVSDATKRTHEIRYLFNVLNGMDETIFMEKLILNKKNFIGYSVTSYEYFCNLCDSVKSKIKIQIDKDNDRPDIEAPHKKDPHKKDLSKEDSSKEEPHKVYPHKATIYSEIVFGFDGLNCARKVARQNKNVYYTIMDNFLQQSYISNILKEPKKATDIEHDKARKAFLLLFFADYMLDPPPDDYFNDFYLSLDQALEQCGYARLYYANPYDWLILKSVKLASASHLTAPDDPDEPDEPDTALELFNEILSLLADNTMNGED